MSGIVPYLIGLAIAAVSALGLWFGGRKSAKAETALEAAERYAKTTERMQDADAAMGDDPAVLRDSLRHRDPKQR